MVILAVDRVETEPPSSANRPPSPERPVRRSRSAKRGRYRRYPAEAKLRANPRRNAGDLFQAAHANTARWRLGRAPATPAPSGLAQFEGISPPEQRAIATTGYLWRFSTRRPGASEVPPSPLIPTLTTIPKNTTPSYFGGALKGRLLVCAKRSDPYAGNLMGSELAYVTRSEVTNPDNTNVRNISDPSNEVHDRIDNDGKPQFITPRRQNVARRVLYWERRYQPIPI